jgi:hypothetical protein
MPCALNSSLVCLAILLVWETNWIKQYPFRQWMHGSVLVVVAGVLLNKLFMFFYPEWALGASHLVSYLPNYVQLAESSVSPPTGQSRYYRCPALSIPGCSRSHVYKGLVLLQFYWSSAIN